MHKILLLFVCILGVSLGTQAQVTLNTSLETISYGNPRQYVLGGVTVSGTKHLDQNTLIQISGLKIGETLVVPGDDITQAVEKLWEQGLFSDVQITATKIQGNSIFLNFFLEERPRLSKFKFIGIKKSDIDALREKIKLVRGKIITESLISNTQNIIRDFYVEKGFLNVEINIEQEKDSQSKKHVLLVINIHKGEKVKISEIKFVGNTIFKEKKLKRLLKETKEKKFYRLFKASKYLEDAYKTDKNNIIINYNEKGFRDAKIITDSIWLNEEGHLSVRIHISEGSPYYFGNITWVGNSKYSNNELDNLLGIEKGDIYDNTVLQTRLLGSPDSRDVHSKYLDNGYLFSQVTPVETEVRNDTIDLEIRIYEGQQARINKVTVIGNTKTNDHVIMREIRTKPGDLFNRSLIMRSQRELATLNYFDPEKLDIDVSPDPQNGTVDLTYVVEEKSTDQIELQGGYGANRIIGTFRLSFNNFSARKMFAKGKGNWTPLPSGDGQRLSLAASSNGLYYQSGNISFTEPWLGGKKPNALTIGSWHSVQRSPTDTVMPIDSMPKMKITGVTVGLGKRLQWPDDFFTLHQNITLKKYNLDEWTNFNSLGSGTAYNYSYNFSLGRNSVDQPTFPRRGSNMKLSVQLTPPYSLFDGIEDYSNLTDNEKFKWVEYHKWNIGANWFISLADKLVLKTNLDYGLIGTYNPDIGLSPFERYYLGGDGLSGYALDDREVIALRGYSNGALSPDYGATLYNKYTLELRYALSLNPQSPIYALSFLEAGNSWDNFDNFDPFTVKRSAGVGIRITIPMMGMMGVDWGYGFDDILGNPDANKGQFHFSINQQF
ncbi:MAG: outer membrane protein assembly factor BamA [Flavobacteriales bacterium]|nr:outer membrane protein assembly factor BamA [Flavobacteriales bacterium]